MATYTCELADVWRTGRGPAGGAFFVWDVTALATAKSWTLAISDTINTPLLDPQQFGLGPIDIVHAFKFTPSTNNADVVGIDIFPHPDTAISCLTPWHNPLGTGNYVCYNAAANNSVWVLGTPATVFRPRLVISATGVPAQIYFGFALFPRRF